MGNTLTKAKTLTAYVPGVTTDPGFPGRPATPERVTYEPRAVRYEAGTNFMVRNSNGTWSTPLDELRRMIRNPGLSAVAAHYSDVWGIVEINGKKERGPLRWTSAWIERTEQVRVVIPAQPALPPRAPVAGSPPRSTYDMHLGWNAGAQSVKELPSNWVGVATFEVGQVVGAVVGFSLASDAPVGRRSSFSSIRYGLLIADGRIKLREGGVTTRDLGAAPAVAAIEAMINGGVIEWSVNGTLRHRGPFRMAGDYVMDAVLYAGDDGIDSPALVDGVPSDNGSNLILPSLRLILGGDGEGANLKLKAIVAGDPNGQAALSFAPLRATGDPMSRGLARIHPVRVSSADRGNNGFSEMRLARMTSAAEMVSGDDAYVPAYSIGNLAMLPVLAGGSGLSGGVITAELALLGLDVTASQDAYGDARLAVGPLETIGDGEAITPLVRAEEVLGSRPIAAATYFITLVVAESMGAISAASIAAAVVTAGQVEELRADGQASITATIIGSMLEQIGLPDKVRALTFRVDDGAPVLVDEGNAWVVNTDSSATTRYESYSFNSFMAVGGRHFGVRSDGVFLLEGATDAGADIGAGVALGKHDFGSLELKHIESIYAGLSATGQLFLKVKAPGGDEFTYRARRVERDMRQQRFDPGRGLRANYFEFDLVNEPGGGFELDNITFSVVPTKRRI